MIYECQGYPFTHQGFTRTETMKMKEW